MVVIRFPETKEKYEIEIVEGYSRLWELVPY